MDKMIPPLEIGVAKKVDSTFIDYKRFEGNADYRAKERTRFFDGEIWAPEYDYPNLDALYDFSDDTDADKTKKTFLLERKAAIQQAVYRLELARISGEIDPNEAELYALFHEARLKKMMLVEAAKRLQVGGGAEQTVVRREFMDLNVEVFGEFDEQTYLGMLRTERDRTDTFEPQDDTARAIKADLERFFGNKDLQETEEELLDTEFLGRMQPYVRQRYADVLAVVPGDDENRQYNAPEIEAIFTEAFDIIGFTEKGWKTIIDPKKSNPATAANRHKIALPAKMARTPSRIEQLLAHEMEVHARRGQNGEDSGLKFLQKGTANYADVEEGLGVLLECILAGSTNNPAFHRARDRYLTAGLALGVEDAPRDARQTFEIMWRLLAVRDANDGTIDEEAQHRAMDEAYKHVENAFRGTNFAMPGIIYTKLKIYYEGLQKNVEFFREHLDNLDEAFEIAMLGKYDHTDPRERALVRALIS